MIQDRLLRLAARRWRDDGPMLAEWRAELSALDSAWDRLRFALSLAASRPHHLRAWSPPPKHTIPAIVTSFVLLLAFPCVEIVLVFHSTSWLAVFGAGVLGAVFAKVTAALTNLIKPSLLPAWVFGVQFLFLASQISPPGVLVGLLSLSLWLGGGVASGMVVVRLIRRGRAPIAWAFIAVVVPVVFLLLSVPLALTSDYMFGYPEVELSRIVSAAASSPFLHLAFFGLVYLRGLATASGKPR